MNHHHLMPARKALPCLFLFALICLFSSCEKDNPEVSDNSHEIISLTLRKANGSVIDSSTVSVTIVNDTIRVTVPEETDLTALTPVIIISGISISPASGVQQDFSSPVQYTVTAEDGSQGIYTVIIKNAIPANLVFFGSGDNSFYALNAKTGALKWKYSSTASFAYSSPTYKDGVVYVGGIDNYVYAFKASTGEVLWKQLTGQTGIESDAVIHGNTVYVGNNDDDFMALDAQTGNLKWSFRTGSNVSSSAVIFQNLVCFGSSDGNMYALDTATGRYVWHYQTNAMINQSAACLYNETLYVGSRDRNLYAIDAQTGILKWSYPAGVSLEACSPTVANNRVYMGGWYNFPGNQEAGSFFALDAVTGNLVWNKLENTGFSSSPCVANNIVYIGADDLYFYALNAANGETLWKKQLLTNSASASVSDGIVYIGGGGTHNFYALDALNGNEKWRFPVQNGLMTSTPLILDSNGFPNQPSNYGVDGQQVGKR
ncbi:MAG: hypothetical protein EOO09_03560 [Chitinophagaceae bacterium]|nr:MAG: hypothetical protein EOO09_03560 [Chitinophagaceae bacterium]